MTVALGPALHRPEIWDEVGNKILRNIMLYGVFERTYSHIVLTSSFILLTHPFSQCRPAVLKVIPVSPLSYSQPSPPRTSPHTTSSPAPPAATSC